MSDDDLRQLLEDAVADVTPRDRLGEIRRRTAAGAKRTGTLGRRWTPVVIGAGVATAAVVAGVALVGRFGLPGTDAPTTRPGSQRVAVATYFVADTPDGERLFREFQSVPAADEPTAVALAALQRLEADAGALDPDYRTAWPDGSFTGVTLTDGLIRVELADRVLPMPAAPAAQQAVFTVQAALGQTLPVQFATPEGVLDVDGASAVSRDNDALTPVNITDPAEGHSVDQRLTLRGTVRAADRSGDAAVTSVPWTLTADDGDVALSGDAPITGGTWEQTADIGTLAPGTYVLTVTLPTGVGGPVADTRTLTIR